MVPGLYVRLFAEAQAIELYNRSCGTLVPHFRLVEMSTEDWIVEIDGPDGSAFEGRKIRFSIEFPLNFPFSPPMIKSLDTMENTGFTKNQLLSFEGLRY